MTQNAPHMKKTFEWRFAGSLTMYGVTTAIMVLRSQLDAVVMERPFALALRGNISPVTTQAQGPQVAAKKALQGGQRTEKVRLCRATHMYVHTKATRA